MENKKNGSVSELVDNHELIEYVWDKINNTLDKRDVTDKHFYSVKIHFRPSRIDYHKFELEQLYIYARKIFNGLNSLGGIPNRIFWKKYFNGGIRLMTIQNDDSEFPTFSLVLILYSDADNLDVLLPKNIETRVKLVNSRLYTEIEYIGRQPILRDKIDLAFKIDLMSEAVLRLGEKNRNAIMRLVNQRPVYLLELFRKSKQVSYSVV